MSQILGCKACLLDQRIRRGIERGEGRAQWRWDLGVDACVERLEPGAEHSRMNFREEQRGPAAGMA